MLSSAPQLKPPSLTTFSEGIFLTYPHWIDFSFSMFPWPWRWIISATRSSWSTGNGLKLSNWRTITQKKEVPWEQAEESMILTRTPYTGGRVPTPGPPWASHSSSILQMPSSFIHIVVWTLLRITAGITVYYFFQSIYDSLKLTHLFTGLSHLPSLEYSRL